MEASQIKYKQTAGDIQEVCDEVRDLLVSKNESYGDSALAPKRIFSRADLIEQINVRLDDKLSRLAFGRGDLIPEDIELDIMGYLILRRIARKRAKMEDHAKSVDQQALPRVPLNTLKAVTCDLPPKGWTCSRFKGHEGPCAASPILDPNQLDGGDPKHGNGGDPKPWERTAKPESTRESFGEHH